MYEYLILQRQYHIVDVILHFDCSPNDILWI